MMSMELSVALPLLLLQFITCARCDVVIEPCTVLVIKSQMTYITEYINTTECCDNWCLMQCNKSVPIVVSRTTYVSMYNCCPGYGGDNCLPVCNNSCNSNQLCTAPNSCDCRYGWTGENCAQVDGLIVINVEAASISLQWQRANNDNLNGYFILWNEDQNETIDSNINSTIITGLTPHTNYCCCVVPLLISGNGTEVCVQQLTLQAEPGTYPVPAISYVGSSFLLVEWSPPTVPNGIISHYTLYINYSSSSISVSIVDSQFNIFSITNLTQNQSVGVSISASTVAGEGPHSPFVFDTSIGNKNASIIITEQGKYEITTSDITQIRWTPPTNMSMVMVKYYVITLVKIAGDVTKQAEWTLANDQLLDIAISLDPYTPYRLDSLVITELGAIGLFHSLTFFTEEEMPSTHPTIKEIRRETPSSIVVKWRELSLTESRGHVLSYTIDYGVTFGSCDNVLPLKTINTSNVFIILDNLDVQMDYCVRVAAMTSVGVGPWSALTLVNVFPYGVFTIYFSGVGDCRKWLTIDDIYKADNLTQIISGIISKDCLCQFSYKHVGEQQFSCLESYRDFVVFQGRIVATSISSSSEILSVLQKWVDEEATIPLHGIQLQVINDCSIYEEIDTCTFVNNSTQEIEPLSCSKVATTVLAVLFAITLVLLMFTCVMLWTCFCHFTKSNKTSLLYTDVHIPIEVYRKNSPCSNEHD